MNLSYFISKRFSKTGDRSFSSVVSVIAIASVALAVAILILTFLILGSFKENIQTKLFAFDSHIIAYKYNTDPTFEEQPISTEVDIYQHPEKVEGVKHVQVFAQKMGMVMRNNEVYGTLFKGVGRDFDTTKFEPYKKEGRFIRFEDSVSSKEVLVSAKIAKQADIQIGDYLKVAFLRTSDQRNGIPQSRLRKYTVVGIFKTDLEDVDDKMMLVDIKEIQKLNNWNDNQVSGIEVYIDDLSDIDKVNENVLNYLESDLQTLKISDRYFQIFDWFKLLNTNVQILISIVMCVCCFNMFSTMYILVMERTNMIGVLKSLGAKDRQVAKIFWYNGFRLTLVGLIIGNVIGLGLAFLQYQYKFIPLDPQSYYMDAVPIYWNWPIIIGVNVFVIVFINVVLIAPVAIIAGVNPIKAIRFN